MKEISKGLRNLIGKIPESSVDNKGNIKVFCGDNCFATGRLFDLNDGNKWVLWDTTFVPEDYQQYGIGTKLSKSLLETAKENGASKVYCKIESLGGLKTIKKQNPKNLRFVDAKGYIEIYDRPVINLPNDDIAKKIAQQGGESEVGVTFDL